MPVPESDPAPSAPERPDAPPNRAPEQVLELLARFEAGRRRGALDAHHDVAAAEAGVTQGPEDR